MRPIAACLALACLLLPPPVGAQETALTVELNKLEETGSACRTYFVVRNGLGTGVERLALDVFLFDTGGVILERAAIESAPVGPGRTRVGVFEFPGLACAGIGELLMNGIIACEGAEGPVPGCAEALAVSSRAGAGFVD